MHMSSVSGLIQLFFGLAFSLTALASEAVVIARYDAALGTLPQAQGFAIEQTSSSSHPAPKVESGALHQFAQTVPLSDQRQFWYTPNTTYNFTTASYLLEVEMRVVSSSFDPNSFGAPRSGYYMNVTSSDSRGYVLGITSGGVTLQNNINATTSVIPFDTTGSFHRYSLIAQDQLAVLSIDGIEIATIQSGANNGGSPAFGAAFGDSTMRGVSETLTRNFVVTALPVPEAGALWMMLLGAFVVGLLARRSSRLAIP